MDKGVNNVIEVKDLFKSYGEVKAVKGLSFCVKEGELFAFLGVNGAGKSTTINMLCTLLKPDSGEVRICGYDLTREADKIRSNIGIVFQGSVLDARLSVKENLSSRAAFYGIFGEEFKKRLNELDGLLDLAPILSRPYGKLSGGQRRRVDLARGLVNTPKLLFLDEPTTGLDPQTRKTVWQVIDSLRREGLTVFLTTHYMEEADSATNVVIIDEGRIAATGSPVELKSAYSMDCLKVYCERDLAHDEAFSAYGFKYDNGAYIIRLKDSASSKEILLNLSDLITDFEVVKGNMDDVFLNVTGKKLQGGDDEK